MRSRRVNCQGQARKPIAQTLGGNPCKHNGNYECVRSLILFSPVLFSMISLNAGPRHGRACTRKTQSRHARKLHRTCGSGLRNAWRTACPHRTFHRMIQTSRRLAHENWKVSIGDMPTSRRSAGRLVWSCLDGGIRHAWQGRVVSKGNVSHMFSQVSQTV
jgi:hypothetical protein